jgi:hypothetical protein
MYAFSGIMDWIEAFAPLPFGQPLISFLLWPAPSLHAWPEKQGSKRLYWAKLLIGWFPSLWPIVWWLAIVPPWLERGPAKLKRPGM